MRPACRSRGKHGGIVVRASIAQTRFRRSPLKAADKVKGLHHRMKAFFIAHSAPSGSGLLAIGRLARITACDSRGRHGQRGQPYQARYDSGHEFSHRTLLCERNFNIGPAARAFKQTAIESTHRRARPNA
jgi:hypothetical protein